MNSKKNQFDESFLTAFALDELDPSRKAIVQQSLVLNPAFAGEVESIRGLAGLLRETFQGAEELSLGATRREQIFKSLERANPEVLVLDHAKRSRRQSLAAVAGMAAVLTIGFYALSRVKFGVAEDEMLSQRNESAQEVREGVVGGANAKTELANAGVSDGEGVENQLAFVEKSLAWQGILPPPQAFQINQWIKVARVTEEPALVLGGAKVSSEFAKSPWHPERALLMVSFEPNAADPESASAELVFDSERVRTSRLLNGGDAGAGIFALAPGISLFELELLTGDASVGTVSLHLRSGAEGYHPLMSELRSARECSEGFKVAALLGEFAHWASGEERNQESLAEMATAAEELLRVVKDAEIRYALDLILLTRDAGTRD